MSMSFTEKLQKIHNNFLSEMYHASCFDSRTFTILPTVFFSVGFFILTYYFVHRYTYQTTPMKRLFYKALCFHWTYFYSMRIWYLLLKIIKSTSNKIENYVQSINMEQPPFYLNANFYHNFMFGILLLMGVIPGIVAAIKILTKRHIPNFLLWIGEDPWLRSEIGLAGHYLIRPIFLMIRTKENAPYRTQKAISLVHFCKSVHDLRKIRSEEILKSNICFVKKRNNVLRLQSYYD